MPSVGVMRATLSRQPVTVPPCTGWIPTSFPSRTGSTSAIRRRSSRWCAPSTGARQASRIRWRRTSGSWSPAARAPATSSSRPRSRRRSSSSSPGWGPSRRTAGPSSSSAPRPSSWPTSWPGRPRMHWMDSLEFPERGWDDLRNDPDRAGGLEEELRTELGKGSPRNDALLEVVASAWPQDDVIVKTTGRCRDRPPHLARQEGTPGLARVGGPVPGGAGGRASVRGRAATTTAVRSSRPGPRPRG